MANFKLKICLLLCALIALNCENLHAQPSTSASSCTEQNDGERLDVSLTDLLFTEKGIYLIDSEELIPLKALYSDSKGFFIILPRDKIWNDCPNGHRIYHQACGGCANWWCAFRCKCHSPW